MIRKTNSMKCYALLALLILQLSAKSQLVSSSVFNTSGSSYAGGAYSFDWSVGESAIVEPMKNDAALIVITNGFLQPDLPRTIPVNQFTDEELKILPNPTYNKIELKIATIHQGMLMISLYDARGRMMYSGKKICSGVLGSEKIDLTTFVAGTYFLKVELDPKTGFLPKTGSYKIVKL